MAVRIDANVILRYLTNEPADQAERAARLLEAAKSGATQLLVEEVVLAEVIWTLSSFYRVSKRDIAAMLLAFLAPDGIQNPQKDALKTALVLLTTYNLDFADALIAAKALESGQSELYSFDRDFDRIPGILRKEPT